MHDVGTVFSFFPVFEWNVSEEKVHRERRTYNALQSKSQIIVQQLRQFFSINSFSWTDERRWRGV